MYFKIFHPPRLKCLSFALVFCFISATHMNCHKQCAKKCMPCYRYHSVAVTYYSYVCKVAANLSYHRAKSSCKAGRWAWGTQGEFIPPLVISWRNLRMLRQFGGKCGMSWEKLEGVILTHPSLCPSSHPTPTCGNLINPTHGSIF